jgi:hypothetical protein
VVNSSTPILVNSSEPFDTLDETNGNVRAAREFSGHASIEVLMRYDDNRKDVGGEVASKVVRRVMKLFEDVKG